MRALSDQDILDVWDRGVAARPAYRALLLLASSCPGEAIEKLAGLYIGQRDSMLLDLRTMTFGSKLRCLATCPKCKERFDLVFDSSEIRIASKNKVGETQSLIAGGFEVFFRLPNSLDLLAIGECRDVSSARGILLERCILSARQDGKDIPPGLLPSVLTDCLEKKMESEDPQADIQISLSCPSCSENWSQAFDIVSFFWSEIDFWARRILEEVSALAKAYGWSEAEILALSPRRREMYLEMANR